MKHTLKTMALCFDLDGTLVDSLPAVEHCWTQFCHRNGLDPQVVLPSIHGRRAIDSIRAWVPEAKVDSEFEILRRDESTYLEGVTPQPGSVELIDSLPKDRWIIVTSGTRDVATARASVLGVKLQERDVCGEDVANGKPHPEPYLLGCERLGFHAMDCCGFEDVDAGVKAIDQAGMTSVSVHAHAVARFNVGSLADVKFVGMEGDWLTLEIETLSAPQL